MIQQVIAIEGSPSIHPFHVYTIFLYLGVRFFANQYDCTLSFNTDFPVDLHSSIMHGSDCLVSYSFSYPAFRLIFPRNR